MKVAQKLKEENIAEYLIYMWQVEDLIRANGCDIDRMCSNIVSRYPEEERAALKEWYGNLIEMMRAEGVTEKGHLQINRNVILNLTDLHAALLSSTKYPFYNAAYFKALPFIVELRQKTERPTNPNWKPVSKPCTAYCCLNFRNGKSLREQHVPSKPSAVFFPCWRPIMPRSGKVNWKTCDRISGEGFCSKTKIVHRSIIFLSINFLNEYFNNRCQRSAWQ